MEREHEAHPLVELGAASERTLGADGYSFDLVREIPKTGISED